MVWFGLAWMGLPLLARSPTHPVSLVLVVVQVDLRMYSQKIDAELRVVEAASLPGYVAAAPGVAELDNAIGKCSKTLRTMEDVFSKFQVCASDHAPVRLCVRV